MKCKIFNDNNESYLEKEINDWLATGRYEITSITQSQDGDYITITIFYLTEKELRAKKLRKLNNYESNDEEAI